MIEIILANFGFWLNLSIPIIIGLYLAITNKEYIWKEFGIQTVATLVYVSIVFALAFSVSTDIWDTNYYNSKVKSSTYFEEWKERVTYTESYPCGTSKHPRTCTRIKTRIDYHPPYYEIKTSLNETEQIKRRDFLKFKREFGAKVVYLHRTNQVSYGDGNKFVSYPNKDIPVAIGHTYENIVAVANNNVINTKVPKETLKLLVKNGKVREYPSLYRGAYGETLLNRVIDTVGIKNNSYLDTLNDISKDVGETKQANPIIYFTDEDRSIKNFISQYWHKGKKNDVTLILGLDKNKNIVWSDVICFTNNTDFIVDLQNEFKGLNVEKDSKKILSKFKNSINKNYVRKPMKEFEYLKENITLKWYWQLIILLGNIILSGFIAYKFLRN